MHSLQAECAAMDALRDLVGIFIWYPADENSPEYPVEPVTQIDLGGTSIDDGGLVHLRHFRRLQWLCLEDTGISDAGLMHLHALRSLRELELRHTCATARGIERLRRALPNCEVRH